jgi:protein-tyrosine phosphatase
MSFYNEILPNLYLGSIEASENFNFIESNNISVIVNCSKDIVNKFSLNLLKPIEDAPPDVQKWLFDNSYYIKYYRIPVDDSGKQKDIDDFYKYLKEILHVIIDEYKNGKKILVHCLAGNQRSAAFVCAFVMVYKNISLQDSIKFVLEKKPNVFFFGTQINFMDALAGNLGSPATPL